MDQESKTSEVSTVKKFFFAFFKRKGRKMRETNENEDFMLHKAPRKDDEMVSWKQLKKIMCFQTALFFLILFFVTLIICFISFKPTKAVSSRTSLSINVDKSFDQNHIVSFNEDGDVEKGAGISLYRHVGDLFEKEVHYPLFGDLSSSKKIFSYYSSSSKSSMINILGYKIDASYRYKMEKKSSHALKAYKIIDFASVNPNQLVFVLQHFQMGNLALVYGSIHNRTGQINLMENKLLALSKGYSHAGKITALDRGKFAVVFYEDYGNHAGIRWTQFVATASVDANKGIILSDLLSFGELNTQTDDVSAMLTSTTFGNPIYSPASNNMFVVPWFTQSNATDNSRYSGLCFNVNRVNNGLSSPSLLNTKCLTQYQPDYFLDATYINKNNFAITFFDKLNNYALTVLLVNMKNNKIIARDAFVIDQSGVGAFEVDSFPQISLKLIGKNQLVVAFPDPSNAAEPSIHLLRITPNYRIQDWTPSLALNQYPLTERSSSYLLPSFDIVLLSSNSFAVAYSSGVPDSFGISIFEVKSAPSGIIKRRNGESNANLIISGSVKIHSQILNPLRRYYTTTTGELVTGTSLGNGFISVDNGLVLVSEDAYVGTALSKEILKISN